jgi:hypothetical protein
MAALQAVKPEEWPVGQRIKCPKCGGEGKAGVSVFKAKGREYVYLVVNHSDGRKCVIARADKAVLQSVKQAAGEDALRLREENEKLKAEVARLREENRQLREAIATVYNAKIAWAGPQERRGFYLAAVRHRKGEVPAELRPVIDGLLETLSSVDWVAVRLDAFEQLRGFL